MTTIMNCNSVVSNALYNTVTIMWCSVFKTFVAWLCHMCGRYR